jgi:hypothetical protein
MRVSDDQVRLESLEYCCVCVGDTPPGETAPYKSWNETGGYLHSHLLISNAPIVGYVPFEETVTGASSDQWMHEDTQSRRQCQ